MKILTFDIEEWFHCDFISDSSNWDNYEIRIYKATDRILESLQKRNLRGTFFVLGWIADKYPDIIRKIHTGGHEIGCHSFMHTLVSQMNREAFRKDTERAVKVLEDITGNRITMYRAPGFSITEKNPWAFEILADLGILIDSSVFPSRHDYGGFPSFSGQTPVIIDYCGHSLKEFPINTVTFLNNSYVFSGGGYFRLFPYSLIKRLTKEKEYIISYFHPRDFDYDQPRLNHLPALRRFKSYVGLKTAYPKYLRFIDDFKMLSIGQADSLIDWANTKHFSIK